MKPFEEQNYYEVLEVSPNALPLEIRRAYKKSFALYQDDSIASYSFFSGEERQEILSRIDCRLFHGPYTVACIEAFVPQGIEQFSQPLLDLLVGKLFLDEKEDIEV